MVLGNVEIAYVGPQMLVPPYRFLGNLPFLVSFAPVGQVSLLCPEAIRRTDLVFDLPGRGPDVQRLTGGVVFRCVLW